MNKALTIFTGNLNSFAAFVNTYTNDVRAVEWREHIILLAKGRIVHEAVHAIQMHKLATTSIKRKRNTAACQKTDKTVCD